jgi:hypothetical protein
MKRKQGKKQKREKRLKYEFELEGLVHLSSLDPTVQQALQKASSYLNSLSSPTITEIKRLQGLADDARESTFPFLENEQIYNDAYAAASYLIATSFLLELKFEQIDKDKDALKQKALRALDLGMIRGGISKWGPVCATLVNEASSLESSNDPIEPTQPPKNQNQKIIPPPSQFLDEPFAKSIRRIDSRTLTVQEFTLEYMNVNLPVILTHALDTWPAITKWNNPEYIKRKAASRLVPIETCAKEDAGKSFLSNTWTHKVMQLDEYIATYIVKENEPVDSDNLHGYLAQHPLFDQIPSLKDDIRIPEYCNARTSLDEDVPTDVEFFDGSNPKIASWFGPKDTVSPIHNDPFHNVLAQVVGSKYLRLYDASKADRLYTFSGDLGNNSSIDIDNPDYEKYPLFRDLECWQTILQPGELLYIPRLCWHYVRSLEMSFSVSFWFGAEMQLTKIGKKIEYVRNYIKE